MCHSDLVCLAQQSAPCSVHHTAAMPPTVPLSRHCEGRHTLLLTCQHHHAVHAGLPHAVLHRSPETKHALHCCNICRQTVTIHTHTHNRFTALWNMSRTTRVSRYQKGKTRKVKTNLDLLEQEIVSGSGICWGTGICNAYSLRPPARSPHAGDTWVHLP